MRSIIKRGWFQIGTGGLMLFIATRQALVFTENPNFVPTFILLGAFIVPASFAAYFYRQEHILDRNVHDGIPLIEAALMFFIGGIVGTLMAGVLESITPNKSDVSFLLAVGIIEETSKLIFPVIVFLQGRYRSEADGLLFGVATGMGFAALETMGYSLGVLMGPFGTMTDLEQILIMRGLLSPLGHAAWTGLICGAMWHYRNQGIKKLALMTGLYFLLAVFLHFSWNMAASVDNPWITFSIMGGIGALSLYLVFNHLKHAKSELQRA